MTLTRHSTGALPLTNTTSTAPLQAGLSGNSGVTGNSGSTAASVKSGSSSGHTGSTTSTVAKSSQTTTTTTAPVVASSISPSQILVQLFNGSGVSGQVGAAASALASIGFRINGIADAATFSYTASVILYSPGQEGSAQTLQHYIGGATTLQASASVPSTEVQLITGTDFTGVINS